MALKLLSLIQRWLFCLSRFSLVSRLLPKSDCRRPPGSGSKRRQFGFSLKPPHSGIGGGLAGSVAIVLIAAVSRRCCRPKLLRDGEFGKFLPLDAPVQRHYRKLLLR
jgi:hypothetical protein